MKKIFKLKRTYFIITTILLFVAFLSIFFFIPNSSNSDQAFINSTNKFNSNQYAITSGSQSGDTNIIAMANLYNIANDSVGTVSPNSGFNTAASGKTITIATYRDLYAFSSLCSNTSTQSYFLAYNYKLVNNIDYSASPYPFMPIGWNYADGFTGLFDGNGYEINRLSFISVKNPDADISPYAEMEYFAMFSHIGSAAVVSNFGLVEPLIKNTISAFYLPNCLGVSPVFGLNEGEVSYIFVRDLRDVEQAGIYATGGYQISGFGGRNQGNLHDCYVAYSRIVNYEVSDYIDFNEFLLTESDSSLDNNLFFFNSSIDTYTYDGETNKETVIYKIEIGQTYSNRDHFATYVGALSGNNSIASEVLATNTSLSSGTWYNNSSYDGIGNELNIITPITRGITYNNTTKTFTIKNEGNYCYMYELMNSNSVFASSIYTYEITSNLNLALIDASNYYYGSNIAAVIRGISGTYNTTMLENNTYSTYPTIFNPAYSLSILAEGVESYGLFPYLSGSVSNLNIVIDTHTFRANSLANINAIGLVAGYVDGGKISNINVKYNNISTTGSYGKYYFGSIAGILTNNCEVTNVTAAGSYLDQANSSNVTVTGYDQGNSVGGIVGYLTSSPSNVYNALSVVGLSINSTGGADYAVGGVIGSGYTKNNASNNQIRTSNLENRGSITISRTTISNLAVAGIIGHLYGLSNQISDINNAGDISLASGGTLSTLVCGALNVDLNSSSALKAVGKRQFYASSITNGANIAVNCSLTNLAYTNVLNIKNNNYSSTISGIYNLGYRSDSTNASLNNQTINMTNIKDFAPVINHLNGASGYELNASTIYNLRSINYSFVSAITSSVTLNYSGCILGSFINFEDIRNEGNLTYSLNYGSSTNMSSLSISGLFDILSANCEANKLYNGGNISVTDSTTSAKFFNLYISGICKNNYSVISDETYNPLNSSFNDKSVGSLNNVINKGNINVISEISSNNVGYNEVSANMNLHANVYIGGITYCNSGIISNSFNLGLINVKTYSQEATTYQAGGIACQNDGRYAQIRDCANNGDVIIVDMSQELSQIDAGGIIAINNGTSTNINEVIAFTINYGTIQSFNAGEIFRATNGADVDQYHVRAGGIISQGACNTVNVVNYGNIFSSECAAGLISIVDMKEFSNDEMNIANTINYGVVKNVARIYSTQLISINYSNYNEILSREYSRYGDKVVGPYMGALFTVFDFNNRSNLNIRYLINLYDRTNIVSSNVHASGQINVSTFITTSSSSDFFGTDDNYLSYAPLSTVEDAAGNIGVFSKEFSFRRAIDGLGLDSTKITDSYISDFYQFVRFDKINDSLLDSIGWTVIAYADAANGLARNLNALSTLITNSSSEDLLAVAFSNNTWLTNCDKDLVTSFIDKSISSNEINTQLSTILNYVLFDETSKASFTNEIKASIIGNIVEYFDNQDNYYELLNDLLYDKLLAKIISKDSNDYETVYNKIKEILETSDNLETILGNYIGVLQTEIGSLSADSTSVLYPLFDSSTGTIYLSSKIELVRTLLEGYDETALSQIFSSLGSSVAEDDLAKYTNYLMNNGEACEDIYSHLFTYNSLSNSDYLDYINTIFKKDNISALITTSCDFNQDLITNWTNSTRFSVYQQSNYQAEEVRTKTPTIFSGNSTDLLVPNKDYSNVWNKIKNSSAVQNYIYDNLFPKDSEGKNIPYIYDYVANKSMNKIGLLAQATEKNNTYQSNDAPMSSYGLGENMTDGQYAAYGISYASDAIVNGGQYLGVRKAKTDTVINTMFVYTPDSAVSQGTYFYGPLTTLGTPFKGPECNDSNNYYLAKNNYKLGYNLATVPDGTVAQKYRDMVPIFLSPSNELLISKFNENNYAYNDQTDITTYYYHTSSGISDVGFVSAFIWKSEQIIQYNKTDAQVMLYKNTKSNDYVQYDFNYDPNYNWTISQLNSDGLIVDSNGNHANKANYFAASASACILTGIYYMLASYAPSSGGDHYNSLMTKLFDGPGAGANQNPSVTHNGETGRGIYGVHTTDYIVYDINDLVNLDGIRTKGYCDRNVINSSSNSYYHMIDNDEVNIISAIVTKMLEDENGKKVIIEALADYAEKNNFMSTDAETVNLLMNSLKTTSFAQDTIVKDLAIVVDFNYSLTITLANYLAQMNIQDYKYYDKIISSCTNNLAAFRKLIITLKNYESNYLGTRSNLDIAVYNYVKYLYSNDDTIPDSTINSMLSTVNDSELSELYNLSSYSLASYENKGIIFTNILVDLATDSLAIAGNNCTLALAPEFDQNIVTAYVKFNGVIDGVSSDGTEEEIISFVNSRTKNVSLGTEIISASLSSTSVFDLVHPTFTISSSIAGGTGNNELMTYNTAYEQYSSSPIYYNASESGTINPSQFFEQKVISYVLTHDKVITGTISVTLPYQNTVIKSVDVNIITGRTSQATNSVTFNGSTQSLNQKIPNGTANDAIYTSQKHFIFTDQNLVANSFDIGVVTSVASSGNDDKIYVIKSIIVDYEATLYDNTVLVIKQNILDDNCLNSNTFSEPNVDTNRNYVDISNDEGFDACITYGNTSDYKTINSLVQSFTNFVRYIVADDAKIKFDISYQDSQILSFINNYDSMSSYGKYLFKDYIFELPLNTSSFTLPYDSYVLIKGYNTYTGNNGTCQIDSNIESFTDTNTYYLFKQTAGTHNLIKNNVNITNIYYFSVKMQIIATTSNLINYVRVSDGNKTNLIVDYDYSALSSYTLPTGISSYHELVANYPYYRDNLLDNQNKDTIAQIMTFLGTMKENDRIANKEYYNLFIEALLEGQNVFDNSKLIEIISLIAIADYNSIDDLETEEDESSTLSKLILLANGDYSGLLKSFDLFSIQKAIIEKIIDIVNLDRSSYPVITKYVYGMFLGNDYLSATAITNTKMSEILDTYEDGIYQFINLDQSVDAQKFTDLIEHLAGNSSSINLDSYGIFALSSSKGINDGIFIPDNFSLSQMDVNYHQNENHEWELFEGELSAEWRGGTTSDYDSISDETSVNYGFLVDMKQLKKSISTAIFNLDLSSSTYTLYSSSELIDLDNHIITYYVPSGWLTAGEQKSFTINKLTIANSASSSLIINNTLILRLGSNSNKIVITAEDTKVVAEYSIILKEMEISFGITRISNSSIPYVNGQVIISLTSPVSGEATTPLPEKFDLAPYIYLVNEETGNIVDSFNHSNALPFTYLSLSNDNNDHYVNQAGNSTIVINVDASLPQGDYRIYLNIFNTYGCGLNSESAKYVSFTKNPSTEKDMTNVSFDGQLVNFIGSNNQYFATSSIPFGRSYNDTDLLNMNYLDFLPTFSAGASCSIEVEKIAEDEENAIMTYIIVYTVTAENGDQAVYTHQLIEQTPFVINNLGQSFATWYKDGVSLGTKTYSPNGDNSIKEDFERGFAPIYRIKYEMSYFYTNGDVTYTSSSSITSGVSVTTLFAGLQAQITDVADSGEYEFTYTYISTGMWEGVEYQRIYVFPNLVVSKNASKDSTLSRITFLDSYQTASGLSTIIRPNYAMLPIDTGSQNEIYYNTMFDPSFVRDIAIQDKTVNYAYKGPSYNYATTDITDSYFTQDFFVLGSIANAELSSYAPTFAIEDHAEIYQYTTLVKLSEYGINQTRTDTEILTDRLDTSIFIYVPYISGNLTNVFMIELDNGKWTNVYTTNFNGSNQAPIKNLNGDRNATISYEGKTYTLDSSAGKPTQNTSLYMDYIGSPKENHFWFVSYLVLSEDYLTDSEIGTASFDNQQYKCYHISLIDMTNTVFFEISIKAPEVFLMDSLYLTLALNTYTQVNNETVKTPRQISAYADKDLTTAFVGFSSYTMNSNLSVLPNGYFYFYVDLPEGYTSNCTVTNNKTNRNVSGNEGYNASEDGAYLPPTSIVTQRIKLLIEIESNQTTDGTIWGESTSTVYTRQIIFAGVNNSGL